jgi:hypothetical protein
MKKNIFLIVFILFANILFAQKAFNNTELKKDQITVINFLIQKIKGNKTVYLSNILGGINFNNNLACSNEVVISRILNDSLGLSITADFFKNLDESLKINKSYLSDSKVVRLVNFSEAKSLKQPVLKLSKPRFFENNQYCLASFEIDEFTFGNIVLSKVKGQWIERLVICESFVYQ